uniref:amidase n=1 Tax=Gibberella subglutinans TaxID=42677 RepID=A0A109QT22_GIBSU|nr:amidase [Fusarium subglutinans]
MATSKYTIKVHKPWTEIVTKKRAIRDAQIDKHLKVDINFQFDSISLETVDVEGLTGLLREGKVSAVQVIYAFIRREVDITVPNLSMLTVILEPAKRKNRKLDGFRQEHGQLIGPLHGVPVTVKDQFNIRGLDSTLGYVAKAFAPAENDAPLIETLKKLGAVIIAKTNLPQSIMWCETDNPLWGLTTHPDDPKLTPGGSSGGEAAMLSMGASIIGWGKDIGGSIRIPCHMNGLWGLKPSSGRMSYRGVEVTLDGIFQTMATRPLVIGAMLDDGIVKVHPPIERVFRDLITKLEAAGHDVVQWDSSLNSSIIDIMDGYYSADGGEDVRRAVSAGGEPFIPQIEAFVNRGTPISVFEYWQLNKRKIAIQEAYHDMWEAKKSPSGRSVDILLVPTMPHTAVPHGSCRWTGYTKIFNLLDYTALTFPAGKASRNENDGGFWEHVPRNKIDAWNQQLYDPVAMEGRHVGLQIVGRRFEEEKVLGAAQQIYRLL